MVIAIMLVPNGIWTII